MNNEHLLRCVANKSGFDLTGYEWLSTPFYTGFAKRNFCEEGFELQSSYWNPIESSNDFLAVIIKLKNLDIDISSFRRNVLFDAIGYAELLP